MSCCLRQSLTLRMPVLNVIFNDFGVFHISRGLLKLPSETFSANWTFLKVDASQAFVPANKVVSLSFHRWRPHLEAQQPADTQCGAPDLYECAQST
jgi:hypothetical protein